MGKVQFFVGKSQVPSGSGGESIRVVPQSGNILPSIRVERMNPKNANGGNVWKKAQAKAGMKWEGNGIWYP